MDFTPWDWHGLSTKLPRVSDVILWGLWKVHSSMLKFSRLLALQPGARHLCTIKCIFSALLIVGAMMASPGRSS